MAFKYRGKDRKVEDVVRRSKQAGGGYDNYTSPDVSNFKIPEGDNQIRILPPSWLDDEEAVKKFGDSWDCGIYVHTNVGPDKNSYLCLDKMKGERCPVCEARADAADEEEDRQLRPQWRALCYVIDRDDEKAGPQLMNMGVKLFREINARGVDKKGGGLILLDDPEEGFDVFFHRDGTGLKTTYTQVEVDRDPSPVHDKEATQDRWLKFIEDNPIPDTLVFFPPEHIEKVLHGKAKSGGDGEEGSSRRRGRGREETSDEEEDRGGRRGRGRGEESGDEEGRSSRRRGREEASDDDDKGERSSRRGRGEEQEERSSRRRGREETDDDDKGGEREERSSRRDRGSSDDDGGERSSRRRGREREDGDGERDRDAESEQEGREARSSRRGREEADEDDKGGDDKVERRRPKDRGGDKDDSPTGQAQERLGRLRSRARD